MRKDGNRSFLRTDTDEFINPRHIVRMYARGNVVMAELTTGTHAVVVTCRDVFANAGDEAPTPLGAKMSADMCLGFLAEHGWLQPDHVSIIWDTEGLDCYPKSKKVRKDAASRRKTHYECLQMAEHAPDED